MECPHWDRRPPPQAGRARLLPSRDFPGLRPPSPSDGEGLGERSSRDLTFAFGYSAYFAVHPQAPQAPAPKPFIADSRVRILPNSAFRVLPSAFALHRHAPAILSRSEE